MKYLSSISSLLFLFGIIFFTPTVFASALLTSTAPLPERCLHSLRALPGKSNAEALEKACAEVKQIEGCHSHLGVPIFHYERISSQTNPKRILAFSLIHGDEMPSGSVARSWMERLSAIEPRNSWRIVPILNPDGLAKRTRMNANGVDLNRNFPTKNWEKESKRYWEKEVKNDPRRFPGTKSASEIETRCAIKHIEEYDPDFIISLHTPYGVLDFDGPPIQFPKAPLPWQSLGNYPGSLGRYMWHDRKHPVLTVELQEKGVVEQLEVFDRLQDITGDIAIKSEKILQQKIGKEKSFKKNGKDKSTNKK
jgi:hypothetical protein